MTQEPQWTRLEGFQHLEWRPSSATNAYYFRVLGEPSTEVIIETKSEMVQWVADHSARPTHIPVGDWVHNVTKLLGIKRCGDCAERQAKLNNWLKR
jgi:hypothetical protein